MAAADEGSGGGRETLALIFDCDGTLVDTEQPYMDAFNAALAKLHRGPGAAPAVDSEVWGRDCSGRGLEHDAEYAVSTLGLSTTSGEFLDLWKKNFAELTESPGSIPLLPGFDELYAYARGGGLRVAVASSSDAAGLRRKLTNGVVANSRVVSGLDAFDAIISNDDVTKHKPDPEIYLLTAEKLGVAPGACWVVEDTATGVSAGRRAGMCVAAVPNRFTRLTNDFSEADVVLESMADVVGVLEALTTATAC